MAASYTNILWWWSPPTEVGSWPTFCQNYQTWHIIFPVLLLITTPESYTNAKTICLHTCHNIRIQSFNRYKCFTVICRLRSLMWLICAHKYGTQLTTLTDTLIFYPHTCTLLWPQLGQVVTQNQTVATGRSMWEVTFATFYTWSACLKLDKKCQVCICIHSVKFGMLRIGKTQNLNSRSN